MWKYGGGEEPAENGRRTGPVSSVSATDGNAGDDNSFHRRRGPVPTVFASKESGEALSPDKRYALVVLSGKEPGKVIPIDKARVTIGRTGCDVVLDDTELSRQHVLIAINGTSARLEDLGSTNGTYVDETRVEQAALEDRSEFRIGSHELLFVMTDREGPPQAAG